MHYIESEHLPSECFVLTGDNGNFKGHFHENLELIYIKDGNRLITVGGRQFVLSKGDLAFVYPCVLHEYKELDGGSCAWVGINPAFLEDFCSRLFCEAPACPIIKKDEQSEKLCTLLNVLFSEKCDNAVFIKGAVTAALALCEPLLKLVPRSRDTEINTADVLRYVIINRCSAEMTAESAAKHFGLGERRFCDWFRGSFSVGFRKFLNRLRLNDAELLLENSNMTVTEICFKSGFENIRTFNRAFLSEYGCSPLEFRKNVRNNGAN